MQKWPPEKHPCWRPLLIQNIAKFFWALILKNICKRLYLQMFMKLEKLKIIDKVF